MVRLAARARRAWRARRGDEEGYALLAALIVTVVLAVMTLTATLATASNMVSAANGFSADSATQAASSLADATFAQVTADTGYFTPVEAGQPDTAPFFSGPDAMAGRWYSFDKPFSSTPPPCANAYQQVCAEVTGAATPDPATLPGVPTAPLTVLLDITAVTHCQQYATSGGVVSSVTLASCRSVQHVQQRLVQRQYFDYLYFDQLETLDPYLYDGTAATNNVSQSQAEANCGAPAAQRPSYCVDVPFLGPYEGTGGDVLSGPIYTDDATFYACGSPTFSTVVTTGAQAVTEMPNCSGSPSYAGGSGPITGAPDVPLPSSDAYLAQIAGSAGTVGVPSSGQVTIQLDLAEAGTCPAGQIAIDGSCTAPPPNGVLYVPGDAYVSGNYCSTSLTIAAAPDSSAGTPGDIYVTGDLRRVNPTTGAYGDPSGGGTAQSVGCPGVVGLVATGHVWVLGGPGGAPTGQDLHLDAAVMALHGSFATYHFDSTPTASPHHIDFYGAIAEKYRGAFGAFANSGAIQGQLLDGWAKDFVYDPQLTEVQPPYSVSPDASPWAQTEETTT